MAERMSQKNAGRARMTVKRSTESGADPPWIISIPAGIEDAGIERDVVDL